MTSDFISVTQREWKYAQECVKTVNKLKKRIKELEKIRSEIDKDFPLEPHEEKTLDILQELQELWRENNDSR